MNTTHYQPDYQSYLKHWMYRLIRNYTLRMNPTCVYCKSAPATEVNHLKYPAWGAFDTPSNIESVCHDCHAEYHKKTT